MLSVHLADSQHVTSTVPDIPPPQSSEDEDEEIDEFGRKLLKLDIEKKQRKKRSFQKTVPDPPENDYGATDNGDQADEADVIDPGISEPGDSPRLPKKRVRFLGLDEVFASRLTSTLPSNPAPLPPVPPPLPPPLPPNFFEKEPDSSLPEHIPPPPSHPPPVVPRPPLLPENVFSKGPPSLSSESPEAIHEPPKSTIQQHQQLEDIFTITRDGETYINRAAFRLYTKFIDELAEFTALQAKVTKKRVQVQERRGMLRLQREYIRQCDVALFGEFQACVDRAKIGDIDNLQKLLQSAQKARDDTLPLEDHYEALDLELGAAEFALKEKFGALELRYENLFKLQGTSISTAPAPSSFSFEPTESSEEDFQRNDVGPQSLIHGALVGNAVRIGQPPLKASEEPSLAAAAPEPPQPRPKLKRSDGSLESIEFTRRPVSPADKVENFDFKQASLESWERIMSENLRGIGDLTAVFNPSTSKGAGVLHPNIDGGSFVESHYEEFHLDENSLNPAHRDAESLLLLGSDNHTQSTLSDYLMKFDSTRDRVNRWLLHKLRVSPREVFDLQRKVRNAHQDIPDWATRALDMWDKDAIGFGSTYTPGSESSEHLPEYFSTPEQYPGTANETKTHRRNRSRQISPSDFLRFQSSVIPLGKEHIGPIDPAMLAPSL